MSGASPDGSGEVGRQRQQAEHHSGHETFTEAVHDAFEEPHQGDDAVLVERADPRHPSVDTVEAVVRRQMAASLGGKRGMAEAGIPSILFTVLWLLTKDLRLALIVAGGAAVAALAVRLAQRGPTQYVLNAIFGIAIGWVFVRLAASGGGSETEQALAFFLPGLITSGIYTIVGAISCITRWPLMGFMVGSFTGDPTAWRQDPQVVTLCQRLTWVFLIPGGVGVLLQAPIWVLGHTGPLSASAAVAIISVLRFGVGWALKIGSWATMIWLLARNATPIDPAARRGPETA